MTSTANSSLRIWARKVVTKPSRHSLRLLALRELDKKHRTPPNTVDRKNNNS